MQRRGQAKSRPLWCWGSCWSIVSCELERMKANRGLSWFWLKRFWSSSGSNRGGCFAARGVAARCWVPAPLQRRLWRLERRLIWTLMFFSITPLPQRTEAILRPIERRSLAGISASYRSLRSLRRPQKIPKEGVELFGLGLLHGARAQRFEHAFALRFPERVMRRYSPFVTATKSRVARAMCQRPRAGVPGETRPRARRSRPSSPTNAFSLRW